MNDHRLLNLVSKGDAKAFELLVRRYYSALLGFVSGIVQNSHDAEDIVQEVFVHLWEKRADSEKINSLRSYLYVCSRNLAMNHIRSEERLKERHSRLLPAEEEDFRSFVIEEETFRLLNNAIESLPPRSATVLKLTIQGLSLDEIANNMQVSINTVKSTKAYAINKIKERLEVRT